MQPFSQTKGGAILRNRATSFQVLAEQEVTTRRRHPELRAENVKAVMGTGADLNSSAQL
jgi:hypothetical protein